MKLSQHFNRNEFKCKCGFCDFDTVDAELINVLERIRRWANSPVVITSGVRCPDHNSRVGGSPKSQHLQGKAADIQVKDFDPKTIYNLLDEMYPDQYGLGYYRGWVHVDVRDTKARWKDE